MKKITFAAFLLVAAMSVSLMGTTVFATSDCPLCEITGWTQVGQNTIFNSGSCSTCETMTFYGSMNLPMNGGNNQAAQPQASGYSDDIRTQRFLAALRGEPDPMEAKAAETTQTASTLNQKQDKLTAEKKVEVFVKAMIDRGYDRRSIAFLACMEGFADQLVEDCLNRLMK